MDLYPITASQKTYCRETGFKHLTPNEILLRRIILHLYMQHFSDCSIVANVQEIGKYYMASNSCCTKLFQLHLRRAMITRYEGRGRLLHDNK